ncbi:leucine-rich repeat domain-containing protein [uncultured Alistipes sp.]|uniref:leucine-rich repeat domain-containing protein n=1 Tax=uncultured Alistipes sp. TaxID=538949 RepID=UPI00272D747D|nr:leucine-rich repeat protein [uncultured Alistipes sp.]
MKKLFLLAALCVAAAFSSCSKHDGVETPDSPDLPDLPDKQPQELAIAFAEGNSLQFNANETKTIHYTITGGDDKTVVKAKMQNPNGTYTLYTTQTSATEGTISITANTPETENCIIVTVSDGSQTVTAEIAVSTKPIPEELAITFAEGNSLEFNVNETKTINYTITGGSDNTVVTAGMQTPDNAYAVETTPASTTEGTITIMAQMPSTENCVIVTVSDGNRSITAKIDVTLKASFDGKTAVVVTPGSLSKLLADYVQTRITQLTVIGNLNDKDIVTLKNLPNLAILDMENANLEALPAKAFYKNTSLTSVKLPRMLKTIGNSAFEGCSSLTSVTIPGGVTSVGWSAFYRCSSLKSITIPNSVTSIGDYAFYWCSSLTSITLPDGMTKIGDYVFYGCSKLTSITIPDSVTTIGESAFSNCGFDWITIGSSVTTIWGNTFDDCHASSISCKAQTPPTIATISTGAYWYKWTLYVPIGCKKAYAAQYWKGAEAIREKKFE